MKKTRTYGLTDTIGLLKMIKIMRFTIFILFLSLSQTFAMNSYSQQAKLSLDMRNVRLEDVLDRIEKNSEFFFMYNKSIIDVDRKVDIQVEEKNINEVLIKIFANTGITYSIKDRQILLINNRIADTGNESSSQQQKTVSGRVTDSSGSSLPGVSVVVKGTTNGTITDTDGNYSLSNIPENSTLQFSFVGMKLQEVLVKGKTTISITLEEETIGIEEVVAIGYGVQKKVSSTSPISQMKGEEMARRPIANTQQSLQGLAPGVTIVDGGGVPGRSAATLRVRGITTLSGNNDPLILVDGIEQRLDDINPSDIDNVSILKDAASTAIYGSRAANGVVLVTTKRGAKDQITINYSGYVAMQEANNTPEHMGLENYMRYQNLAYTNVGMQPLFTEEQIQTRVNATDRIQYPLPNVWFDELYKKAPLFDQNLSISGGSDKVQGRASVRWQEQNGIVSSVFNKVNEARANLDFNPYSKLKLSVDLNYRQNYSRNGAAVNGSSLWHYMYHGSQWAVPRYPDGTYGISKQGNSPLLYNDLSGYDKLNKGMLVANLKLDFEILPHLKFNGQYSLRDNNNVQKVFNNTIQVYDYTDKTKLLKNVDKNSLTENREDIIETTLTTLLNYERNIAKNQIKFLAGYSEIYNKLNYTRCAIENK